MVSTGELEHLEERNWLLHSYRDAVTTPDPYTGQDTFDLIDDAVAALADRRGVWLGDDLATIVLIASLIEQAERWLPQLVHDARVNGHGWSEIARALRTGPDEARLHSTLNHPLRTPDGPTTTNSVVV